PVLASVSFFLIVPAAIVLALSPAITKINGQKIWISPMRATRMKKIHPAGTLISDRNCNILFEIDNF
ncbi:MAG: hypothetical protein NC831_09335, partial [Candidatus Omnitrophica bacterium]|nr:hypothetical protein [Candidatus Omnitrophota bacterium]